MVVMLAMAGLAVSNLLIMHERNEKTAALEQAQRDEQRVKEQLRRTDDALNLGLLAFDQLNEGYYRVYEDWATDSFLLPHEMERWRRAQAIFGRMIQCNPDVESGGFGTAYASERVAESYMSSQYCPVISRTGFSG